MSNDTYSKNFNMLHLAFGAIEGAGDKNELGYRECKAVFNKPLEPSTFIGIRCYSSCLSGCFCRCSAFEKVAS